MQINKVAPWKDQEYHIYTLERQSPGKFRWDYLKYAAQRYFMTINKTFFVFFQGNSVNTCASNLGKAG